MLLKDFVPGGVGAYGLIPFIAFLLVSLLCSILFMRYYWKSHERDRLSAITSTLGLWFALLTSFLLPLDVFLVSFMKNLDGTFKDWATNSTRMSVENGLTCAYYSLYGVILVFAFFLLPFVYFAYEEKSEDEESLYKRFCPAICYATLFMLGAGVLLLVGAFIPYRQIPVSNGTDTTEWEILEQLFSRMYTNRGTDALYFILNILMLIGMIMLMYYTGVGLSAFPISCVRGWRSIETEKDTLEERKAALLAKKSNLQSKGNLTRQQQSTLNELQEEEHLLSRMENEIQSLSHGFCYRMSPIFKILQLIFGIVGILLGILIWLSLLLSNVDKLLNSLGYRDGYLLSITHIVNPLDYVMVQCQKVFPLDYIIFFGIVVFLICCTVSAVRHLGIQCLCIRLYRIRPHKTEPQALIMLCGKLMFTVLALNFFIYSTIPQYTTFGSQHYRNETSNEAIPCSHEAPKDECLMTQASTFLVGFTTKAWIFGMLFYWITWAFLLFVILGFLWAVFRQKPSYISEVVDRDDFEDSDSDVRPIIA